MDTATVAHTPIARPPLQRSVVRMMRENDLSFAGVSVISMCSGGVDSVVLVDVLASMPRGYRPAELHVLWLDHGRRDSSGDRRAAFEAAARAGATFHCAAAGESQLDQAPAGFQAQARAWRYEQAAQLAAATGSTFVATGHSASDQLETVLSGLIGDGGTRSLAGMRIARPLDSACPDVQLVRPLLACTRLRIESHASDRQLQWHEDPTNVSTDRYRRNALRHRVVPVLEEIDPRGARAMTRTLQRAADAAGAADSLAGVVLDSWEPASAHATAAGSRLPVRHLAQLPRAAQRAVVAEWLRRAGVGRSLSTRAVEAVIQLADSCARGASAGRVVELERARVRPDGYHLQFQSVTRSAPEDLP